MLKNILIVGSSGAIGSSFLKALNQDQKVGKIYALSRGQTADKVNANKIEYINIDITNEDEISLVAAKLSSFEPLNQIIIATGMLHSKEVMPEKSLHQLNQQNLSKLMTVNAFAPVLLIKHFLPLLSKKERTVIAVLSARVGSIADNKLGGWYSYRAAKAALNMLIKTTSIEVKRKLPKAIIVALHPGTVDSKLSAPFQSYVAAGKLFAPEYATKQLLKVIASLDYKDTGCFYAWDGTKIDF